MKDRRSGKERRNWTSRLKYVKKYRKFQESGLNKDDVVREMCLSRNIIDRIAQEQGDYNRA